VLLDTVNLLVTKDELHRPHAIFPPDEHERPDFECAFQLVPKPPPFLRMRRTTAAPGEAADGSVRYVVLFMPGIAPDDAEVSSKVLDVHTRQVVVEIGGRRWAIAINTDDITLKPEELIRAP